MNKSKENKSPSWEWAWPLLAAGVAYLANTADTHVQRVRVAASSIQYLGCQLHYQVLSPCVTLECAGGSRIVVSWKPFIITPLILDVIVGGALLGSEVFCIRRAVLEAEKKGHVHISQGDKPTGGWTSFQEVSRAQIPPCASHLGVPSFLPLSFQTQDRIYSRGVLLGAPW